MNKKALYILGFKGVTPLLAFLILGGTFSYFGLQTIHIQAEKDDQGAVGLDFTRKHFFGLVKIRKHIEGVTKADTSYTISRSIIGSRDGTESTQTAVSISGKSGDVKLFAGSSDSNGEKKRKLVRTINRFLQYDDKVHFNETFTLLNIFGMIGFPIMFIWILGTLSWIKAVVVYLNTGKLPTW